MSTVVLDGGPTWLFLLGRLVEIAVVVLLTVVWCNSMERAIRACNPLSRKIQSGQSWMIFIPLFGFIWQFIAVNRVSDTLAMEYHLRGWKTDEGRPGIETGLIVCVLVVVVVILRSFIFLNPLLDLVMSMAICICMYMHRERINAFTERLEKENKKATNNFDFFTGPSQFLPPHFQPTNHQSFDHPIFPAPGQYYNGPANQVQTHENFPPQPYAPPATDPDRWKPK